MACPDCGLASGEFRFATSIETHGLDCGPFERFDEEFIVCGGCGGRFDPRDWEESEDALYSVWEGAESPDEGNDASGDELGSPGSAVPPPSVPFLTAPRPYSQRRSFDVETGSEGPL